MVNELVALLGRNLELVGRGSRTSELTSSAHEGQNLCPGAGIGHQLRYALFGAQVVLLGVDRQRTQGLHVGVAVGRIHVDLVEQHALDCRPCLLQPRRGYVERVLPADLSVRKQQFFQLVVLGNVGKNLGDSKTGHRTKGWVETDTLRQPGQRCAEWGVDAGEEFGNRARHREGEHLFASRRVAVDKATTVHVWVALRQTVVHLVELAVHVDVVGHRETCVAAQNVTPCCFKRSNDSQRVLEVVPG